MLSRRNRRQGSPAGAMCNAQNACGCPRSVHMQRHGHVPRCRTPECPNALSGQVPAEVRQERRERFMTRARAISETRLTTRIARSIARSLVRRTVRTRPAALWPMPRDQQQPFHRRGPYPTCIVRHRPDDGRGRSRRLRPLGMPNRLKCAATIKIPSEQRQSHRACRKCFVHMQSCVYVGGFPPVP